MDTDLHLQAIQQARDAEAARLVRARDALDGDAAARPIGPPARRPLLAAMVDALSMRRGRERRRLTPDI
jgi:hypothetical protein